MTHDDNSPRLDVDGRSPHREFTAAELDARFDLVMGRFRASAPFDAAASHDAVGKVATSTRGTAWFIRAELVKRAEEDAARIREDAVRKAAADREAAKKMLAEAQDKAQDIVAVAQIEAASIRSGAPVQRELMVVGAPVAFDGPSTLRPAAVVIAQRVTSRLLSEAELADVVDAALTGERRAVAELLGRIQPLVLRYCRARIGSGERALVSAEDVAQETLLAVVSALGHYRYEPGSFLAFVYGIAAHKVADARRRAQRTREEVVPELPDIPALEDNPGQRAVNSETIKTITELLNRLPDRHREILVLRVAVGLSAEETAVAVGSTAGAVRVAQHRALARMREMFAAVEG